MICLSDGKTLSGGVDGKGGLVTTFLFRVVDLWSWCGWMCIADFV